LVKLEAKTQWHFFGHSVVQGEVPYMIQVTGTSNKPHVSRKKAWTTKNQPISNEQTKCHWIKI